MRKYIHTTPMSLSMIEYNEWMSDTHSYRVEYSIIKKRELTMKSSQNACMHNSYGLKMESLK